MLAENVNTVILGGLPRGTLHAYIYDLYRHFFYRINFFDKTRQDACFQETQSISNFL